MEAVKLPGDIVFDNFVAGGIKSHSKASITQWGREGQNSRVGNLKMGSRFAAANTRGKVLG